MAKAIGYDCPSLLKQAGNYFFSETFFFQSALAGFKNPPSLWL
jgi:hypothetical protein